MGQIPRDAAAGIHHVTVGATGDELYFRDDADRLVWIRRLVRTLDRFAWTCVCVCQMNTHIHAVFEIPDESMPRGMHYLNSFYGKYFNEKNGRRGALIRAPYWSKRIVDDEQLIATFRYIVRNPVRAGLCSAAEDWFWGGFRTSCGFAQTFPFVDASLVLASIGATEKNAAQLLCALARD